MNPPVPALTPDELALGRVEPAWGDCASGFRTGGLRRAHGNLRVRSLLDVHEALERRREQVESGNTLVILLAIAQCAEENLPMPTWLARAFTSRLAGFTTHDARRPGPISLDTLFRSPNLRPGHPARTAADRRDWSLGSDLWGAVREVAHKYRGLDGALAEVLSSGRWGVGKKKARRLFEMVEVSQVHLLRGHIQPIAHLWRREGSPVLSKCGEVDAFPRAATSNKSIVNKDQQ